jgi:hypothetical protein
MVTVEALLERSVELKRELSAFLQDRRIGREFEAELRRQYGEMVVSDDDKIALFVDGFLLGHRLSDGRTRWSGSCGPGAICRVATAT